MQSSDDPDPGSGRETMKPQDFLLQSQIQDHTEKETSNSSCSRFSNVTFRNLKRMPLNLEVEYGESTIQKQPSAWHVIGWDVAQ